MAGEEKPPEQPTAQWRRWAALAIAVLAVAYSILFVRDQMAAPTWDWSVLFLIWGLSLLECDTAFRVRRGTIAPLALAGISCVIVAGVWMVAYLLLSAFSR